MPRIRTPPPLRPAGYEKSSTHVDITLTETELLLWRSVFGSGRMADKIRVIINREAYLIAGVGEPTQVLNQPEPEAGHEARDEIRRHVKAMREILS